VKRPGEWPTPEQVRCHLVWRRFGAFIRVVFSVSDAIAALAEARAEVAP
jgi:hypothetical protein